MNARSRRAAPVGSAPRSGVAPPMTAPARTLRVAVAQYQPRIGDPEGNRTAAVAWVEAAAARGRPARRPPRARLLRVRLQRRGGGRGARRGRRLGGDRRRPGRGLPPPRPARGRRAGRAGRRLPPQQRRGPRARGPAGHLPQAPPLLRRAVLVPAGAGARGRRPPHGPGRGRHLLRPLVPRGRPRPRPPRGRGDRRPDQLGRLLPAAPPRRARVLPGRHHGDGRGGRQRDRRSPAPTGWGRSGG